jgi:hypothetical protein
LFFTLFADILASASSSHKNEIEEEIQMIKAVQESMLQWKAQKQSKHRQKREANVVCYGDLGCFEDSGPFGYIDTLPQSPEEIDTKFYVFSTKKRSENPFLQFSFHEISSYSLLNETLTTTTPSTSNQRMDKNAKLVNKTQSFDPTRVYNRFGNLTGTSMRVIVHGFGSSCPHEWIDEMRAALMVWKIISHVLIKISYHHLSFRLSKSVSSCAQIGKRAQYCRSEILIFSPT